MKLEAERRLAEVLATRERLERELADLEAGAMAVEEARIAAREAAREALREAAINPSEATTKAAEDAKARHLSAVEAVEASFERADQLRDAIAHVIASERVLEAEVARERVAARVAALDAEIAAARPATRAAVLAMLERHLLVVQIRPDQKQLALIVGQGIGGCESIMDGLTTFATLIDEAAARQTLAITTPVEVIEAPPVKEVAPWMQR